MSFFSKRKLDQSQTVSVNATEEVVSAFTESFKAWLSAVERAQVESDADALTPDIISRVGAVPLPQTGNGLLNRTQQVYVWSFARSFTERMAEDTRIQALAAVYRLEESGADTTRSRRAADYWASVEAHTARSLA